MTSLWFATPAWKRFSLSEVCFEQRKRVIDVLRAQGMEAECVVVADDENVDIARSKGFHVVETDNDHGLGRKFNDGYVYAAEHGADWIVPIGSDSWIDSAYFLPLPDDLPSRVRSSHYYSAVTADKMAVCNVAMDRCPAGPYVLHRNLLARANYRPTAEELYRNLDSSSIRSLSPFDWEWRDDHSLQYVGFRDPDQHITSYGALLKRWGLYEDSTPWETLRAFYPQDLVEAARAAITR